MKIATQEGPTTVLVLNAREAVAMRSAVARLALMKMSDIEDECAGPGGSWNQALWDAWRTAQEMFQKMRD